MPEPTAPAPDTGADNTPAIDGLPADTPADKGGETTTPDEVAKVLNLPTPPAGAGDKGTDKPDETGTDDKPTGDEPDETDAKDSDTTTTEENQDDDEDEPEETEPDTKGADNAAEDKPAASDREFVLTVTDANGTEFKIQPGDNLEEILAEFEPKSNGQIMQILKDLQTLENDKSVYEADQQEQYLSEQQEQQVQAIQAGWNDEIKELQAEKRIPATVKGQDNERVEQVYKFMSDENAKRIAAGRPTLNSFADALDKLENIEARQSKETAKNEAREERRKSGSLVGGSSAPNTSSAPAYVAGRAKNASQALRQVGLLK